MASSETQVPQEDDFDWTDDSTTSLGDYPAPEFLRNKNVWVLWRYIERGGKKTKVPLQTNGKNAKSTDPKTWTNYMAAVMALEDDKDSHLYHFDGLGVCFDGTFTGVDVDHCVVDGVINEVGNDIVSTLGSYAEFSPSSTGIHVLVEGEIELTRNRRKDNGVEMYTRGRFFTFTCKKLPNAPQEMIKNVEGLRLAFNKYLYSSTDQSVLDASPGELNKCDAVEPVNNTIDSITKRMELSSKWPEINALMNGITTGYGGDESAADLALCNHLAFFTRRDPKLMDTVFRTSKLMRSKWDELHGSKTYGAMTIDRACADTKMVDGDEARFRYTEGGNANRFSDMHGKDLRYCGHQQEWYVWKDGRWVPDKTGTVYQLARGVVAQLYQEARDKLTKMQQGREDPKTVQLVTKFAKTTDTARGLLNVVKLASTLPEMAVSPEQFDRRPMLLNTIGTTLNFDNPQELLCDPDRSHLLTKQCGVAFDFEAKCPQWEKFISEIFAGDQDVITFVQKAVGYSLTGKVSEKCFFFCWGDGSNGKSVFLNVVRAMFGDYGQQASIRTFLKKKGDSEIRDDLVNLKGARFVTAVEPDESSRFDMEVMKPLTGNDPIRCRTLHQRQIEYLPELKLWLAGNNKPMITETNTGAWDRVRLIPFTVSFVGREDRKLEDKLKAELPGILNWAIRGYRLFVEQGLETPKCVKEATESYRIECNSFLSFVEAQCIISKMPGIEVRASLLYDAYKDHCAKEGQYAFSSKRVRQTLKDSGIERVHTRSGDFYVGITLKEMAPGQVPLSTETADDGPTMGKIERSTP